MALAGRSDVARDAVATVQVEPVSRRQRRRRKRYGNEPRASKPYVRKQRGVGGQKLASQPASPWLGLLSAGELIIVRQAVRRGSVPFALRPIIVQSAWRTFATSKPRRQISTAMTFIVMDEANLSALKRKG